MKCLNCGNELESDAKFCTVCGANIEVMLNEQGEKSEDSLALVNELMGLGELLKAAQMAFSKIESTYHIVLKENEETEDKKAELIVELEAYKKNEDVVRGKLEEYKEKVRKLQLEIAELQSGNQCTCKKVESDVCTNCGKQLSEDMLFCNQCGVMR